MRTKSTPKKTDSNRAADIETIEKMVSYIEQELERLSFPIAARLCGLVQVAMIEQMIIEENTARPAQRARSLI